MKALIPISKEHPEGPFAEQTEDLRICAERDDVMIVEFFETPETVQWFHDFEFMFCRRERDGTAFKVLRAATDEELRLFRVPAWIQDEEIPQCCGKPMIFVGQIDDDRICTEPPPGAKLWWHDFASFYVFTCPECLGVQAVGQQY